MTVSNREQSPRLEGFAGKTVSEPALEPSGKNLTVHPSLQEKEGIRNKHIIRSLLNRFAYSNKGGTAE